MSIRDALREPLHDDDWNAEACVNGWYTDMDVSRLAARRMLEAVIQDIDQTRLDEDIEGTRSDWLAKYLVKRYEQEIQKVKDDS